MTGQIAQRLTSLGITLPKPIVPVANYVPFVISGNQLTISRNISLGPDGLIKGKLGADVSMEQGAQPLVSAGSMSLPRCRQRLAILTVLCG